MPQPQGPVKCRKAFSGDTVAPVPLPPAFFASEVTDALKEEETDAAGRRRCAREREADARANAGALHAVVVGRTLLMSELTKIWLSTDRVLVTAALVQETGPARSLRKFTVTPWL